MSFEVVCPNCSQSLEAEEEMNGMEVDCPSCNTPFTVKIPHQAKIPKTQEVKKCPYCGEEILAKAKKCKHCGEFLDNSAKPATIQPEQEILQKKTVSEKTLWEGHTSHMYYLGYHILWGILGVIVIGLLGNLICFLKAKSMRYKLTNKRIFSEQGILSKKTAEVMIKDVRSVNLKQGMFERMFGLGTIEIGSAGTAGIEVAFSGIPNAPKVKEQIIQLQNELS